MNNSTIINRDIVIEYIGNIISDLSDDQNIKFVMNGINSMRAGDIIDQFIDGNGSLSPIPFFIYLVKKMNEQEWGNIELLDDYEKETGSKKRRLFSKIISKSFSSDDFMLQMSLFGILDILDFDDNEKEKVKKMISDYDKESLIDYCNNTFTSINDNNDTVVLSGLLIMKTFLS